MRDRTVEETFFMFFTTRAFATGIPTVLAGTPVVSAYEDNSITQITAGITLGVDHDGVVGLNLLTLVATGANGFEAGKDYSMVITTGTVGGVSVVGEVVGEFSLGLGAGFTRLGAPAGASVSVDIADLPTVSEFNARTLVAASYFDPTADAVANVTLVDTTTANTDMRGTDSVDTATMRGTDGVDTATMRGTDSAALASVCTEPRLAELDAANLPTDISNLNDVSIADILASQLTESYAADGVAPTLTQLLFLVQQLLGDFSIAGTTLTVREIDGATTAATFTLDSATAPTDITRAT